LEVLRFFIALIALGMARPGMSQGGESGTPAGAWPSDAIYRGATLANDLSFPDAEKDIEPEFQRMVLLRPDGEGPFPGIVMVHQCGGLNLAVFAQARRALARNYVVLVIDSLGPRNVASVCFGPQAGINFFRGARDALQASEHLRRQPFVAKNRIALVGFSWGAMVGLLASSRHYVRALEAGPGFAAVAAFYPGCFRLSPPNGRAPYEVVNPDIDRPLLVLMGEADTETPAAECLEKLGAAKKNGAPIEWHVYSDTTHCWDCQQLDGHTKTDVRGNYVEYRFSQAVTDDSERRLFEFLSRVMPDVSPLAR
jgi:dienelactone hydrolase